jgi:hypothetical protein
MHLEKGFIKLYRSLLDWEWYTDTNTFRLFTHCLLRANYQDTKWRGVDIKRGSFITSLNTLVEETNLSVQNIRTSLDKLKSTGELTSKSHSKYRIVTLNNYDLYQQDNKQLTSKQQATNKELTTDKELKEVNTNKTVIRIPYDDILETWNKTKELCEIRVYQANRKKKIKKVYELDNGKTFKEIVVKSINSDFMVEKKLTNIDWMMNENNYAKILEGKYDNKE